MSLDPNNTVATEWLLSQEELNAYNLEKKNKPPTEQAKDGNNNARRNYWYSLATKSKDMCVINISHALDTWDYKYIAAVIELAEADDETKKIILDINSPGGAVAGLFDLCETIKACNKPVYSYTSTNMCSAAFGIGAATDKIYATESARIGSVGVLVEYVDYSKMYEKMGIETKIITSKNAENKVIDLKSEKGQAIIQERLNRTEDFFIEHIASSRGVTTEKVLSDYGHGSVFFGQEALDKGMVDVLVKNFDECISNINSTEVSGEESIMSLEDLKKKDPDAYAAMMEEAKESAKSNVDTDSIRAQAQKEERERINAIDDFGKLNAIDGVSEVLAKAKSDGTSIEETKALAFDTILANYKAPVSQATDDKSTVAQANIKTLNDLVVENAAETPSVETVAISTPLSEEEQMIAEANALTKMINPKEAE